MWERCKARGVACLPRHHHQINYVMEYKSHTVYLHKERVKYIYMEERYALNDEPCMVIVAKTLQGWICIDATLCVNTLGCLLNHSSHSNLKPSRDKGESLRGGGGGESFRGGRLVGWPIVVLTGVMASSEDETMFLKHVYMKRNFNSHKLCRAVQKD